MKQKKNLSFINHLLKYKTIKWFTFIELIIAITIIAILSVIWFVSYNWHISSSRDSTRKTELSDIYTLLDWYKIKSALPIPNKKIEIYSSWILIWFQWYLSDSIMKKIWFKWTGKDPLDENYYTYYLTKNLRTPWVMGFLENNPKDWSSINSTYYTFVPQVNATDYSERFPILFWKKLWILIDDTNTPIQEIVSLQATWKIELSTLTPNYIAYFDNSTSISNSWTSLDVLYWTTTTWIIWNSCDQYIEEYNWEMLRSGYYLINSSTWTYEEYCDMSWTSWTWTTRIAICSWNLPSNTYATNWNTFIQTYDWVEWLPDTIVWSHTWTSCTFDCNDTHSWSWALNTCIQKINWVCWADHMKNIITPPVSLCSLWDPTPLSQPTPWAWPRTWDCNGRYWWTNISCKTTNYCMVWWMFPCSIF